MDELTHEENLFHRRIQFHKSTKADSALDELQKKYQPINGTQSLKKSSQKPAPLTGERYIESVIGKPKYVLSHREDVSELLHWKKVQKIGAGLRNLGNTCFLNSALQCLTYTPPLANYFAEKKHSKQCRMKNFCMLCLLEEHINESLNSNKVVTPLKIVKNLRSISRNFRLGRQEDSHEFLRFVIEHLQNAFLQSYCSNNKIEVKSLTKIEKETSLIHSIFGGILQSQVKCQVKGCAFESDTFDQFLDLSLDIRGSENIEKAFTRFCKVETLDQNNQYKCSKCHKLSQAKKQLTIFRSPFILMIQLKRFTVFGSKISKKVTYPEVLSLDSFLSRKTDCKGDEYDLFAVLVHSGSSVHSGHYYCFVRSSAKLWYEMNDSSVRQVSSSTALSQEAYLLFYVKRSTLNHKNNNNNNINNNNNSNGTKNDQNGINNNKSPMKDHSMANGNGHNNNENESNNNVEKKSNGKQWRKKQMEIESNGNHQSNGVEEKSNEKVTGKKRKLSIFDSPSSSLNDSDLSNEASPVASTNKAQKLSEKSTPHANGVNIEANGNSSKRYRNIPTVEVKRWDDKDDRSSFGKTTIGDDNTEWRKELEFIYRSKHTALGNEKVTAWDDEDLDPEILSKRKKLLNQYRTEERLQQYKRRDREDMEIDKGKLKKVRTKKPSLFSSPKESNIFQVAYQNRKDGIPTDIKQLRRKKMLSKIRAKSQKNQKR